MALTSPGVQVTVIDQSQYLPAATSSVPLVVFATAQDKVNPNGTGIAAGTTAANAGKLFQVTSQRDLTTLYGTPKFYTTTDGTPIQGYELNEYGLLAAYSALNVTNQCYCLRADIDLASLVASTGRPTGAPPDQTYWYDVTSTIYGIYEWNATTETFANKLPIVITDESSLVGGVPVATLGNIGDYAVIAIENYDPPSYTNDGTYWYKDSTNTWVIVGSPQWVVGIPAVVGTQAPTSLNPGDTFTLTVYGNSAAEVVSVTLQVPSAPNNTVEDVAQLINDLDWYQLTAGVSNGRLQLFLNQETIAEGLDIISGVGSVLDDLGITATTYFAPIASFGTSAQAPLWGEGQDQPRPSGSVWLKVGGAGAGLTPVFKVYNSISGSWVTKNVPLYTNDASAIYNLDPTGGQAIPAGTVIAQYDYPGVNATQHDAAAPVYFWKRVATGETVVTGTNTAPDFSSGPYTVTVYVTGANTSSWSSAYTITVPDNASIDDFITLWQSANIPNTSITETTDGAIQIVHDLGGSIRLSDLNASGVSSGFLAEAGFEAGTTDGVKIGNYIQTSFEDVATSTLGGGIGCTLDITNASLYYVVDAISAPGTTYAVGDVITVDGALLGGASGTNDLVLKVGSVNGSGGITSLTEESTSQEPARQFEIILSNFTQFTYTANEGAPTEIPDSYTNWFYAVTDEVDIMVNTTTGWKGYRNVNYNNQGFPLPSGTNQTDPNGPLVSPTAPTTQYDGTPLVYGDLWIDTGDLENYPLINRWQKISSTKDAWVLIDNTDQLSSQGVLFADARWSTNQNTINPANDPIPSIKSLLTSNNLDLDAPETANYPVGMLLWNTRRSGNNVKQWRNDYFTAANFPDQTYPTITGTWVSASGLKLDGSPYMGRQAQRIMVVDALRSVIDTNTAIRDEDNFFNLMATPAYPEVQQNMVLLNVARGETGYILGDTPMRLSDDATEIQAWANEQAAAGGPFRNTYLGLFYPSGLSNDLDGNQVAVPPSHMMLFTFLRNDQVAYPWFAAAGTRRGIIENASGIGYIDAATGEFQLIKTRIGIRDVLYTNFINPLVYFTGNGLLNYGNKTSYNSQSALDRTNVARLVAYMRRQLTIAARPFVFEPNDAITRQQIAAVVESLMVDLVAKRGIYDYLVVCDESNNTPARIDRNELWVDVAIEPVKAAEFIYIPVRILNTGELSGA